MSVSAVKKISESADPKKAIMDLVKEALPKINLLHGKLLLALYIAPEKTAGGIIRPNSNVKEDVWQGNVGLVLKRGPLAFKDDDVTKFGGGNAEPGQWVAFVPGDGKRIQIASVDCRVIEDTQIMMTLNDPDIVTNYK